MSLPRRNALPSVKMRALLGCCLALGLMACEEEPAVQPISLGPGARPAVTEQPSDILVNPHVRLRERSDEDRAREAERLGLAEGSSDRLRPAERRGGGAGGGGGGGDDMWNPSPADPPSAAELERFQRELADQMEEEVDPEDDPCRQFADVQVAGQNANDTALRENSPRASRAERREMERLCGRMPRSFQQCMDQTYFRAHLDECQAMFARNARRGQAVSDRAREQLEAIRRGDAPLPRPNHGDDDEG
ncbi:MAG: hypothetical protein AB8I08_26380 [Sandaracinaceae bacterium]